MLPRLLLAVFLLAHAAIHTGFIAPRPATGPQWPFELSRSWALNALGVDGEPARLIGKALVAATIGGFGLASLAALGVMPAAIWPGAAAVGAIASISVLLLFFHPWLVLGVAIDLLLLWALLVVRWAPSFLSE
jgi:hypothetical protein